MFNIIQEHKDYDSNRCTAIACNVIEGIPPTVPDCSVGIFQKRYSSCLNLI